MGILTTLGAVALQQEIANTEADVAEAFGMDVALYSQAVASYIADEGTGVPVGTFTSYDWLKDSSCGGSAPDDYLPCTWNPRLPFNIRLETEVVHGTGVPTDPCPEPVGHVCAETRLTVPTTNGQERLELAAEMLHATQGSSNAVRSTTQEFVMNDVGQIQVTARGEQSPPTQYLRRDGMNTMENDLQMGGHNLVGVLDITASGELEGARFIDRDDPSFRVDPNARSVLNNLRGQGDFEGLGGGSLDGDATFNDGADIEADSTFAGEATLHDLARFLGGETDFNGIVNSTGSEPVEFTEADSQNVTNFNDVLEIVGTGVIGGACDATQENMRFNSAGELMECVSAQWQYAGVDTRKGTLTYYSLGATNSYGEFFWAGDGVDIPGRHHVCSAQSIESSNLAEGGGARVESTSGADSLGRRSFQYLASGGVEDSESIPLRLLPGERSVICLALGPEPVQATVSTVTNTAPSGSVSCAGGMTGEPFRSRLSTSDRDDPLLYRWSASGACSLVHANETSAWIQRSTSSGTCTVSVRVTDYYNMSRTISSSCTVRAPGCATVDGACGSSSGSCSSGTQSNFVDPPPDPEPPGWDPRPPPDGDGPWNPPPPDPDTWNCRGSCGGGSDSCTEGDAATSVSGSCSSTIRRCSAGNAGSLTVTRRPDETTYTWTCSGINGGGNDSCTVTHTHTRPCVPATDRENGACGSTLNSCTGGTPETAGPKSWICRGICGGTDDLCSNTGGGVTNGVCGATLNNCAAGSFQSVSGPTWNCLGNDPDATVTSDDALGCAVIVNGSCGTTQGACARGTSSGNTNPWTCQGSNGGADAQCQIAACGSAENTCEVGNYVNLTGTHEWRCMGNVPGQSYDDVTCEVGACGGAQGTCAQGTSSGNTNPWTCNGTHADATVTADDVDCEVGVCGVSDDAANGCTQGAWEDVADTPGLNPVWRCLGSHADSAVTTDDADCTTGLGVCGDTLQACAQGTSVGVGNTWTCRGTDPNTTDDDVECTIGICDFTGGGFGGCSSGTPVTPVNPVTGETNPWTCEGSVGSSTNDDDVCEVGECGIAHNATDGCIVGAYNPLGSFSWECIGLSHGTSNDSPTCWPPSQGCGNVIGECTGDATSSDPSGASNPWRCFGPHPDPSVTIDDYDCSIPLCEYQQDMCEVGTLISSGLPWRCEGLGPTSVFVDCVIGVCDHSGPGLCTHGAAVGNGNEWTCEGSDDMDVRDDADCEIAECKGAGGEDNELRGCETGTWEEVAGPTWNCRGNDNASTNDDDLGCTSITPDGLCGHDFRGDCDAGTSDGGLGNTWTCLGPDGTTDTDDDNCMWGQCPTTSGADGTCLVGTPTYLNGAATYTDGDNWDCEGSSATRTSDDVTCEPVVDGVCGPLDTPAQRCESGEYGDVVGDSWNCLGSNGGTDDLGCEPNPCEAGLSDNRTISGLSCNVNNLDYCFRQYGDEYQNCSITAANPSTILPGGWDGTAFWIIVPDGVSGGEVTLDCCAGPDSATCPAGTTGTPPNCVDDAQSCTLSGFTWISSCGQGQIGCDGYYETNYEHCLVTNPVDGALYYEDAVGYGVDFLAATPPTLGGQFTVEYTCCTNCDDLNSPITDPDNDCNWPAVTAVVNGACGTADNAADGCTSGTYQDVTGAGWTCEGSGGGSDASCGGSCPLTLFNTNCVYQETQVGANPVGGCSPSDPLNHVNMCTAECTASGWNLVQDTCVDTDQSASCGTADNASSGCATGVYSDIAGPTWTCLGFGSGGADVTCP